MKTELRQKLLAHKGTYTAANGAVQKWAEVPALCDSMESNLNAIALCGVALACVAIASIFLA